MSEATSTSITAPEKKYFIRKGVREYDPITFTVPESDTEELAPGEIEEIRKSVAVCPPREVLGISEVNSTFKAGNYVGAVWLIEGKRPLFVLPKIDNLDMLALAGCVLASRANRGRFRECFWYDRAAEPIDLATEAPNRNIWVLELILFMWDLYDFSRKHLKQNFHKIEENLTGKVKGKLDLSNTVRRNLVKAHPERAYCRYTVLTKNIKENQVLKLAFDICRNMLHGNRDVITDDFNRINREIASNMQGIETQPYSAGLFRGLRYSGMFSVYKHIHRSAKSIIRKYHNILAHTDESEAKIRKNMTLPFSIDMNRLFELYVGRQLEIHSADTRWQCQLPLYIRNENNKHFSVQPDYLGVKEDIIVVDAKYKSIFGQLVGDGDGFYLESGGPVVIKHSDIYQILAYAKLIGEGLSHMPTGDNRQVTGILYYPAVGNAGGNKDMLDRGKGLFLTIDGGRIRIYIKPLFCPGIT
ncbi:MAG: hypothetical protein ABIF71_00285 [Planctomycetota bacterium]